METLRQRKMADLLKQELATYFTEVLQQNRAQVLLSVTQVRLTPDLGLAKIYISVFPSDLKESILREIRETKGLIKKNIGTRMRNQLRRLPDFYFYIDDSLDYIEDLEKALKSSPK